MRHFYCCLALFLFSSPVYNQALYFPPTVGDYWADTDPAELGWCTEAIDPLLAFLEEKNTKAFIVLKDGRIVLEEYFGDFSQNDFWYWASAGKTLTAFLVGKAQEEGLLSVEDATADYLGADWTSCPPADEAQITVRDQLTMTTGLENEVPNPDCTLDTCLQCRTSPGSRWFYHNAPYTLLRDVLEAATGLTMNEYTESRLKSATGMRGSWLPLDFNNVYFSDARSMARYGLLTLNRGVWDGDTLLADQNYFDAMTTPSQDLNPAYGYLWWLNGQDSYRLPGLDFAFDGTLIDSAPADLIAGLGKNDQKLYVAPSQNLVVVRMGDSAGIPLFALSDFDDQLWEKLSAVICQPTATASPAGSTKLEVFPNPAYSVVRLSADFQDWAGKTIVLHDMLGRTLLRQAAAPEVDLTGLPGGLYRLILLDADGRRLAGRLLAVAGR